MPIRSCAAIILTLGLAAGCADKSKTATQPAAAPPPQTASAPAGRSAGAAAAPARGGGAGAQAAARLTPEQLSTAMKGIAQANASLQKELKGNMLMEAAKDAQQLATLFGDVERFWAQNNKPDAVKLAQTARSGASDAAGAASAGDQMKAMAAAATVGGTCKQCHSVYREGDPQTGYRIKAGTL